MDNKNNGGVDVSASIEEIIKLARQYVENGMKYYEALDRAKKELGYKRSD